MCLTHAQITSTTGIDTSKSKTQNIPKIIKRALFIELPVINNKSLMHFQIEIFHTKSIITTGALIFVCKNKGLEIDTD